MTSPAARRAVVTGGAGFLGSHLCQRLLERGYEVVAVDNLSTGSRANLAHLSGEAGLRLVQGDVTEALDLAGPVSVVAHLASPASPLDYMRLPVETLRAGSLGTMHALDLARDKGARFLLASTSEVYGDPQVHPQPESYWGHVNPVGPRSVYDEAKRFSEALTTAYRTTYRTDTAIVRIFNTYGPRMRPHDGRAIPAFITAALQGRPIRVTGDGSQTRSPCYVDDLVDGLLAMLDSDLAGPVNLGTPHELTVLELANLVRDLTGSSSPITFAPAVEDDPTVRMPDISRARELLGWAPEVELTTGLARSIEWFRAHEEVRSA